MLSFLRRFTFLQKILGLDNSGQVAKDRLRLVLIHDRSSISPQLMENLKFDLIKIISKYMIIDEETIEMGLDNRNGTVALAANIPILKIKSLDGEAEQLQLLDEDTLPAAPLAQTQETKTQPVEPAEPVISVKTRRRSYNTYRAKRARRRKKAVV